MKNKEEKARDGSRPFRPQCRPDLKGEGPAFRRHAAELQKWRPLFPWAAPAYVRVQWENEHRPGTGTPPIGA